MSIEYLIQTPLPVCIHYKKMRIFEEQREGLSGKFHNAAPRNIVSQSHHSKKCYKVPDKSGKIQYLHFPPS